MKRSCSLKASPHRDTLGMRFSPSSTKCLLQPMQQTMMSSEGTVSLEVPPRGIRALHHSLVGRELSHNLRGDNPSQANSAPNDPIVASRERPIGPSSSHTMPCDNRNHSITRRGDLPIRPMWPRKGMLETIEPSPHRGDDEWTRSMMISADMPMPADARLMTPMAAMVGDAKGRKRHVILAEATLHQPCVWG